ncbi:MAG: ATP synthase F1 subunit gamma [Clostridiales bacterium]|nr:ATP synthase F1 subunit gamma [Clostridiales bacterium]
MSNLSEIKRKIASVKQTKKITGAMQTVSVSKLHKATELYANAQAYFAELDEVMSMLIGSPAARSLSVKPNGNKLVIVITSDRGLCGSFDDDILKFADSVISSDDIVMPVGSFGDEHYRSRPNTDLSFIHSYSASYGVARKMASNILERYGNDINSVSIVFAKSVSGAQQPIELDILPLESTSREDVEVDCFEPSVDAVFQTLLPLYVAGKIYDALCEMNIAEHSARQSAMSTATDSADKVISALSLEYNQARQSAITEQIVEIIGATSALGKQGNGQ